jgi:WD40 repeat protein
MKVRLLVFLAFAGLCTAGAVAASTFQDTDRTYWKHSKGSFKKVADKQWVEKGPDGEHQFVEKARVKAYVELFDKGRNVTVRLTDTQALVKSGKAAFKATYKGTWSRDDIAKKPDPDPKKTEDKTGLFTQLVSIKTTNLGSFGVAVAPDAKQIAWVGGKPGAMDIVLFDMADKKVTKRINTPVNITRLVWSVDGSTLAALYLGEAMKGGRPSQVVVFDTKTWEPKAIFDHPGFPTALALSANGQVVAVANDSITGPGTLKVWDVDGKKEIFTQELNASLVQMALSADGKTVLANGFGPQRDLATAFELPGGKPRAGFKTAVQERLALSADGNTAVGAAYVESGLQVTVWDVANGGKVARVIKGGKWRADSLALIDQDRQVVLGGTSPDVHIYNLSTGQLTYTFAPGQKSGLAVVQAAPDSTVILTLAFDRILRLWKTPFGQ